MTLGIHALQNVMSKKQAGSRQNLPTLGPLPPELTNKLMDFIK